MRSSVKPYYYLLETLVLSGLMVGVCYYFSPDDPLFVHAPFPWVWLLPVLIALRYGRFCAAVAIVIILAVVLHTLHAGLFSWDAYKAWLLGGILLTAICTEYYSLWGRRQHSLAEKENYMNTMLQALSRAYGVLRLSHDRLEEALIIKPATIRQAFIALRELLIKSKGELNASVAAQYMELLTDNAGLDSAAWYLCHGKKWDTKPIAFVGEELSLNLNDPLIKSCIKHKEASYIGLNMLEENELSQYLAVLPMQSADGHLLGLLTISKITFMLLNEETLKKLALMLAYIADEVWAERHAKSIQKIYPDCPPAFASELPKLAHLWKIAKVDSAIVAFRLEASDIRDDVLFLLLNERRALDIFWERHVDDSIILLLLMPLTERSMVTGYIARIQNLLWERKKVKLGQSPVLCKQYQLSTYRNAEAILAGVFQHDAI